MSSIKDIDAAAVWQHGGAQLRSLVASARGAEPLNSSMSDSLVRAFHLDLVLLGIGRAALWKGYDRIGLRASVAAAKARPNSLRANIAAASACRRANEYTSGVLYGRRAAEIDDASGRGNWELAKLLLRIERATTPHGADAELLTALRRASRSSDAAVRHAATLALSDMLRKLGEYSDAERAADLVLSTTPGNIRALRAKADSLVPQSRFADAGLLYRQMLEQEPDNAEIARKVRLLTGLANETPPTRRCSSGSPAGTKQPLLVGIGSGIGDVLHATPMIRNIARRTGRPIEVVIAPDHAHMESFAGNARYVSKVWPISRAVLDRSYETVFLTQFFGPLRFAFQADRIVTSSEWRAFRAGALNDTLLNLEAAKHLLGIPYDETDAQHYFVGDLVWRPPTELLIGFHAGSKSGRWTSKRWPYFAELAARLAARGIRVVCFGTPDEYVPGTEDRTGGKIDEMAREMLACSHFVSNDSGPMHIANALGIPVLAIYAPTDPFSHLPMRASTQAVALNKSCSPCEVKDHRYFASGGCQCVADISTDVIEAKLMKMIARHRIAPSARHVLLVPDGTA